MLDFASDYPVFTHPGQPQMQVEIILASKSTVAGAPPIYTIRMRYPRIIHGEMMTHRVFSRNARSSRAVPVKTMLLETTSIPFIPWHWGKAQGGMQAGEDWNAQVVMFGFTSSVENPDDHEGLNVWSRENYIYTREEAWIHARNRNVEAAKALMDAEFHKQVPNRLLEPFSWMDTLITSTDWANFLWLRDHAAAEPHLQDLARLVQQAIDDCVENDRFQTLSPGEWHQPYITENDRDYSCFDMGHGPDGVDYWAWLNKVSSARCARISYKPFDGDATYERELERYDGLVQTDRVHASPLEHQAAPDSQSTYRKQVCVRQDADGTAIWQTVSEGNDWNHPELAGNLGGGWIQNRKQVPNERHYG